MKRLLVIFAVISLFSSCFRDMHRVVLKGRYPDKNAFDVKFMFSGCCGCTAIYSNVYKEKSLDVQYIHEYKCGFGSPTKFIFEYNEAGVYLGVKGYIAVYDSTYIIPVSIRDKQLFTGMDSLIMIQHPEVKKPLFASITGFRAQKPGERTHPFAIGPKNKAIHMSLIQ